MIEYELDKATLCNSLFCFHLVSLLCPSCWIAVRPQCEWIASPRIASYPTDQIIDISTKSNELYVPGFWKINVFMNYLKQLSCALCHLTVGQRIDHLGKKRFLENNLNSPWRLVPQPRRAIGQAAQPPTQCIFKGV